MKRACRLAALRYLLLRRRRMGLGFGTGTSPEHSAQTLHCRWRYDVTRCSPALAANTGKFNPLLNAYGPTEATTTATVFEIPRPGENPTYQRVPIGRPLANRAIYILDQHRNPVPIGAQGHLYVGGAGLARGYLNRPDLTAERFIPDRFSAEPGARMYQTGDILCRTLKPTTLPLPRVWRQMNAAASVPIDPVPVGRISQGIKRAQRSQQDRVFIFLLPQRRQRSGLLAEVMKPLLHGAEQNGVWADFQEGVVPVFQKALDRGGK
jgi:acyl-CoA synthetase (AMP-forming)/AMP-acid ligase II